LSASARSGYAVCTKETSNFVFCYHKMLTALPFNTLGESSVVLFSAFATSMSVSLPMNDTQIAFQCCRRKLCGVLLCLLGDIASAPSMSTSLPLNDMLPFDVVGKSSVGSFSAFWI